MRLAWLVLIAACGKSDPAPDPKPAEPAAPPTEHKKHEDRHEPATAAPALSLRVHVDGKDETWAQDVFDKVPHTAGANNDGEARDVWQLRDLVHTAVGPNARVVAVIGDTKVPIDAAGWSDATRAPILHRTRKGKLKFRWADKDGKWGDTVVKDVAELDVAR
jgi:hypothetical protein